LKLKTIQLTAISALSILKSMKQMIKSIFASALGTFFGILTFLVIGPILIGVMVHVFQGRTEPVLDKSVLVLDLHGELVEKSRPLDFNFFSSDPFSEDERAVGLFELSHALRQAKTDSRIVGVYVRIRNFQAGWAAAEALRREILEFRNSGKFVYAYSEILDESTFFLATAAEKIFLQPNGEMEFNGLALSMPFLKGLLQKLEIEPRIFRIGKFKAAVEPLTLEKMSEENRQQNQTLVNDVWAVARQAYRNPEKLAQNEDIDRIAAGLEVISPNQALAAGMVQQLAFEDEVRDLMAEKTVGKNEDPRFVSPGQLIGPLLGKKPSPLKNKVAIIFAEGEIVQGSSLRGTIGAKGFIEALEEARADENTKAIVVRINSPGGDALASDVIWRELSITDAEIPVVASLGDIAASGGYYIAAGAREIVAEASTITGSIGVFGVLLNSEDFFRNKLGVSFDRVVSHPYADIGNANRPMTEFERERIQSNVERVYTRFVEVVKSSRKLGDDVDPAMFAEGRVWSGMRAKELKLIDQIGGLDSAVRKAAELAELGENYELDVYPRPEEPFKQIMQMLSGQTVEAMVGFFGVSEAKSVLAELRKSNNKWSESLWKSGVYARLPFELKIH